MRPYPRVVAIILAAGEARRFGSPKQRVLWRGEPLLRHVVLQTLAAPVQEIIVVLGAHIRLVAPLLHDLPITQAVTHQWPQGMSESVKIGLRAIRGEADAALFLLADQPGVTAPLLDRFIQTFAKTGAAIVAPRAGTRRGNPVLFHKKLFPELMKVAGDEGGRGVIQHHQSQIQWIEVEEHIFDDIDKPNDLMPREM